MIIEVKNRIISEAINRLNGIVIESKRDPKFDSSYATKIVVDFIYDSLEENIKQDTTIKLVRVLSEFISKTKP